MYTQGLEHVQQRRALWVEKCKLLVDHLKEIAAYLNENSGFKSGFYVDTFYAFDEQINGTCVEMPSVTLRSGDLPMDIVFKNEDGNAVSYFEKGFQITFNPTPTGQVAVLLFPHHNNFHKVDPVFSPLLVIDDLKAIDLNLIDEIIQRGMQAAIYSSFAGLAEQNQEANQNYNPIGFKRFSSTERASH